MIVHPSYLEMMEKVNEGSEDGNPIVHSRYSIVMAASKRARQVIAADLPEQEGADKKALSIAVDDIMDGKVHVLSEQSENYESYEEDENGRI